MIDCGEGTQRQILRSGLGFKKLDKVLLTHAHLDHILGLGGLVSSLTRWEMTDNLTIYGGKAALHRVKELLFRVVLKGKQPFEIDFVTVRDGDLLFEDKQMTVTAFEVEHRGPDCFGFVFEEKARRPFLPEKAEELQIPIGPERGKLVKGETVVLEDGRQITPDMVLGELIQGVKYVHIGDIAKTTGLKPIVQNASALTIEATFTTEDEEMARQVGHLTARDSAEFARQCNVNQLILTHISRRYRERDIREEAKKTVPTAKVARDFDQFRIQSDKVTRINLIKAK